MKRIFQILTAAVLMLTAMHAFAAQPENFIPADFPVVARVDANRLLKMGIIDKLAEKFPQMQDANYILGKLDSNAGVNIADIINGQLWIANMPGNGNSKGRCMAYMSIGMEEYLFGSLFQRGMVSAEMRDTLFLASINDRPVYIYKMNEAQGNRQIAVTYLAGDVIMITEYNDDLAELINLSLKGGNQLPKVTDRTALAAISAINGQDKQLLPMANVKTAHIKFDMPGIDPIESIALQLKLVCKDRASAITASMQLKMLIPAMMQALFHNDAALAKTMSKATKVQAKGSEVVIDYQLNAAAIQQASVYFMQEENQAMLKNMLPAASIEQ